MGNNQSSSSPLSVVSGSPPVDGVDKHHQEVVYPSALDSTNDETLYSNILLQPQHVETPAQHIQTFNTILQYNIHTYHHHTRDNIHLHTLYRAIRPFIRAATLTQHNTVLSAFAHELAFLANANKVTLLFAPRESAKPNYYYFYALDQYTGTLLQSSLLHVTELYQTEPVLNAIGINRIAPKYNDQINTAKLAALVKLDPENKFSPVALVFPHESKLEKEEKKDTGLDINAVESFGKLLVPILLNPSKSSIAKTTLKSEVPDITTSGSQHPTKVYKFLSELDLKTCIELILEAYAKEFPVDLIAYCTSQTDKGMLTIYIHDTLSKEHRSLSLAISDLDRARAVGIPEQVADVCRTLLFSTKTEIWSDASGGFCFTKGNGAMVFQKNSGFPRKPELVRSAITSYAEIALINSVVWHKQKKAVQQSQALLVISQKLTSELDLQTLLELMMDVLAEITSADKVSLFLASADNSELVKFNSTYISEIRIPKDSGIAGLVYTTGKGLNITDAYEHPKFNPAIDFQLGYRTQSILCTPIELPNVKKIIGVVQIINKMAADGKIIPFDEDDAALVAAFCSQAAISISKSRLFEEIWKSQKRNEALLKVSQKISSQLDLPTLLSTVIEVAKDLLECEQVDIYLKRDAVLNTMESATRAGQVLEREVKEDIKSDLELQVKLVSENEIIGVIEALRKAKGLQFSHEDFLLLSGLAAQVSIALSNSKLFERVRGMKDFLESVQRTIGDFIVVVNRDHMIEFSNRELSELFQTKSRTQNFDEIIGSDSQFWNDVLVIFSGSHKITSNGYLLPNGKIINYSIMPYFAEAGKQPLALVIMHDISEKTEMKSQLEGYKASISNFEKQIFQMEKSMRRMKDNLVQVSESPIQAVIRTLNEILNKKIPFEAQKNKIEDCLLLLKSKDLYEPALLEDANVMETDSEMESIKEYLLSEFSSAHSHRLTSVESASAASAALSPGFRLAATDKLRSWGMNSLNVAIPDLCVWSSKIFRDAMFRRLISSDVDFDCLDNFIVSILRQYRDNPFHNPCHGVSVLQATYMMLWENEDVLKHSEVEGLAILVAALSHDVDHPGRTNAFEINRNSELATLYNDKSVLENHHCAVTFKTLQEDQNNFIQSWDRDKKKYFREIIVASILSTDMARHFQMVAQFNDVKSLAYKPPNGQSVPVDSIRKADLQVLEYMVHCADLSNGVRPFEVSSEWSKALDFEFKAQIADERQLQLPVSTFLLAETPVQFAKRELNFHANIVSPLWGALAKVFPEVQKRTDQLKSNVDRWQQILQNAEQEAAREENETEKKHP